MPKKWNLKEYLSRLVRAITSVQPKDPQAFWADVDLEDFCGPFDHAFSENGDIEIIVSKGSSPVMIPAPQKVVEGIIRNLATGDYLLMQKATGVHMYSKAERDSILMLPEDERKARVWNDYVERVHRPYLNYLKEAFGNEGPAVSSIAVTPGGLNPGIAKTHFAP